MNENIDQMNKEAKWDQGKRKVCPIKRDDGGNNDAQGLPKDFFSYGCVWYNNVSYYQKI